MLASLASPIDASEIRSAFPANFTVEQLISLESSLIISAKLGGVGAASQPSIWIADAHRDNGKRFVARAGEKLTAFLELESAVFPMVIEVSSLRKTPQNITEQHEETLRDLF